MRTRAHKASKNGPSRRMRSTRHTSTRRLPSGSGNSGIQHRRDKRYPMSRKTMPGDVPDEMDNGENASSLEESQQTISTEAGDDARWQEAVMLWLSWNSSYERLSAKMCRQGQDQQKLEAMMDEMDQLRLQAIDVSERLMGE